MRVPSGTAPPRSLLLWGGVDADGNPYLEPALAVDAPPSLPSAGGNHELTGRATDGERLFSLRFGMPGSAGGAGGSSFVFALPVQGEWEDRLASITLSGPEGSATLDRESDRPVAIVRDPRTGQVRGILRDAWALGVAAGDRGGDLLPLQGLEVLSSRGIPGSGAWRR